MRSRLILVLTALSLPLAAGCVSEPEPPPPVVVVMPEPEPEPVRPPSPPPLGFPHSALSLDQAERMLAGDTIALRFLTLRALAEAGLVPPDQTRKNANIGGLLPLTGGRNPSAELELPVPAIEAMIARFQRLDEAGRGTAATRAAERAFLLDQLLPAAPGPGIVMAPHDKIQSRQVLDRLRRLEDTGLITADERARESEAVETLMATLPEILLPPAPPPSPKKVAARTPSGSAAAGRRMPGGVSGRLEVIPSPFEFEPPKITADFTGQAGAHLLSMASSDHGARAWAALKTQYSFELGSHSYAVERADLGSLGVTYRLIAGPMDAQTAERLCAALRAKGQACMPTPFPTVGPVPSPGPAQQ